MKGKYPLKDKIFAFLCVLSIFLLSTCILEPISVERFLDDPKVQDIIGVSRPGESGKYQMIIETDTSGNEKVYFVRANGTITTDFAQIGRLIGTSITGLNKDYAYAVIPAEAFTAGSLILYDDTNYSSTSSAVVTPPPTVAATITLDAPEENYYLNISGILTAPDYDIVMVSLPSAGIPNPPAPFVYPGILVLEGQNTETDYIFAEKDTSGTYTGLRVLTITIAAKSIPSTLELTITFNINDEAATLTINSSTPFELPPDENVIIESQDSLIETPLEINITAPTGDVRLLWNSNNILPSNTIPNGRTFTIGPDMVYDYLTIGEHIFTVELTVGGVAYTTYFILKVTT